MHIPTRKSLPATEARLTQDTGPIEPGERIISITISPTSMRDPSHYEIKTYTAIGNSSRDPGEQEAEIYLLQFGNTLYATSYHTALAKARRKIQSRQKSHPHSPLRHFDTQDLYHMTRAGPLIRELRQ